MLGRGQLCDPPVRVPPDVHNSYLQDRLDFYVRVALA
jgi:hypothetical protein